MVVMFKILLLTVVTQFCLEITYYKEIACRNSEDKLFHTHPVPVLDIQQTITPNKTQDCKWEGMEGRES